MLLHNIEPAECHTSTRIEHQLWAIKSHFEFNKVRHKGLIKNTARLQCSLALTELWMMRK